MRQKLDPGYYWAIHRVCSDKPFVARWCGYLWWKDGDDEGRDLDLEVLGERLSPPTDSGKYSKTETVFLKDATLASLKAGTRGDLAASSAMMALTELKESGVKL